MSQTREQQLSENGWHLNQALIHIEQLHVGRDLVVDHDTQMYYRQKLADLRNACILALPPDEIFDTRESP